MLVRTKRIRRGDISRSSKVTVQFIEMDSPLLDSHDDIGYMLSHSFFWIIKLAHVWNEKPLSYILKPSESWSANEERKNKSPELYWTQHPEFLFWFCKAECYMSVEVSVDRELHRARRRIDLELSIPQVCKETQRWSSWFTSAKLKWSKASEVEGTKSRWVLSERTWVYGGPC